MKKISYWAMCTAVIMTAAVSTTAFADTYDPEKNEVNINGTGYKTVIITKGGDLSQIVYVNQAESEFGASADFLLKSDPETGFYRIMLGGDGNTSQKDFFIGSSDEIGKYAVSEEGAVELKTKFEPVADTDGTYSLAFASEEALSLGSMKAIVVKVGEKYLVKSISTNTYGDGKALVGIKITGVSEDQKQAGMSVYLTPRALEGGEES